MGKYNIGEVWWTHLMGFVICLLSFGKESFRDWINRKVPAYIV